MNQNGSLHKRITRWGSEYCVILHEEDLEGLGLHEGSEIDLTLQPCDCEVDWEALPHRSSPS